MKQPRACCNYCSKEIGNNECSCIGATQQRCIDKLEQQLAETKAELADAIEFLVCSGGEEGIKFVNEYFEGQEK